MTTDFQVTLRTAVILKNTRNLDPETFVEALYAELDPLVDWLARQGVDADMEPVRWMLMELAANAVLARLGRALVERTGFSKDALLGSLDVNPVWGPAEAFTREFDAADPVLKAIEEVAGRPVREYLRLPLVEKFRTLGLHEAPDWVRVRACVRRERGDFETFVESDGAPGPEDAEEIVRRFRDFDGTLAEVKAQAEAYTDARGRMFRPSFTGGGGMGLLVCIRMGKAQDLHLDFLPEEGDRGLTVFRLASFPRE